MHHQLTGNLSDLIMLVTEKATLLCGEFIQVSPKMLLDLGKTIRQLCSKDDRVFWFGF
jgi:hypothetical protein